MNYIHLHDCRKDDGQIIRVKKLEGRKKQVIQNRDPIEKCQRISKKRIMNNIIEIFFSKLSTRNRPSNNTLGATSVEI